MEKVKLTESYLESKKSMKLIKKIDDINLFFKKNNKLKYKEVTILCREMSILLESGCEITKILDILKKEANKNIRNVISNIYGHIQKGNSITKSFQSTQFFSQFFISMIKAGEISGKLDQVMNDLSIYYEKEYKLKSKIINALIYPAILSIICLVSIIFMLIFVIPNFQMVFESNGIDPPFITDIVIKTSMFVRNNLIYIFTVLPILIIIFFIYLKTNKKLKKFFNIIILKIPFVKDITSLIITTKFSRALEIMLISGVQIIDAVEISASIIDNNFVFNRIATSNEKIKKGNSIATSLVLANVFPRLFIEMINIGEESGKLDLSLTTIKKFYENELDNTMDKIVKLIEPMIIVIMGLVVGLCIISMVMPMFNVVSAI